MKAFLLCAATLLATSSAHADPEDEPRSPGTALALSAGGTAASAALLFVGAESSTSEGTRTALALAGFGGLALAPSFGHWYSGNLLSTGLAIRAASVAGGLVLVEVLPCSKSDNSAYECGYSPGAKMIGIVAGAAGIALGIGWDIATAPAAAHDYNRKHAARATVVPAPVGHGYGLVVGGTF